MNQTQLESFMQKLELPNISAFYNQFRANSNTYRLKSLMIAGIMLGKGKPRIKASLLFELYDQEATGFIQSTDIYEMVEEMMSISLDKLPIYAREFD